MATNTFDPSYHRQALRDSIQRITQHLSEFTDLLQSFYECTDHLEAQLARLDDRLDASPVVELPFATSNTTITVVPEPERRSWEMVDVPKKNKKWTSTEEELVVAGRLLGLTHKEIGDRIGRSERSVMSHCTDMRAEGRL